MLVLVVVLAIARIASADSRPPERAIAGVGVSAGVVPEWHYAAITLQAGMRIREAPLRVRVFAARGRAGSTAGSGSLYLATGGIEWLFRCGATVCGVAALDAGYLYSDQGLGNEGYGHKHSGPIVGPRIGVDVAVWRLRFRTDLEFYGFYEAPSGIGPGGWEKALALSVAVVAAI